jgi:hypothetical protein
LAPRSRSIRYRDTMPAPRFEVRLHKTRASRCQGCGRSRLGVRPGPCPFFTPSHLARIRHLCVKRTRPRAYQLT